MGKVKRPMVPVAHSPSPWVAWYDKNEGGLIYQAGVDTKDRHANICVTTCENVEWADTDVEKANALIMADTELIAAAPEMLRALAALRPLYVAIGDHLQSLLDQLRRGATPKPIPAYPGEWERFINVLVMIDTAVAKAKGAAT